MKRYLIAFLLGVVVTLLVARYAWRPAASLTPTVHAQEIPLRGRACTTALVAGTYAFTVEGDILSGNNEGPYAGLGLLTLDAIGNASLTIAQNYDGTVTPAFTTLGRFNVGDDCAGALLFANGSRFDYVASSSGRELNLLQVVTGSVVRGVAKKQ